MTMERMILTVPISTDFVYDRRKDGWTPLTDIPLMGEPTLELAEFLRDNEERVEGETMLSRAKKLGNMAGQRHAEWLLSIQSQIPESWRAFYLLFPGTVWQDTRGHRDVPYLRWVDGRWSLSWHWLGDGWSRRARLVRVSE